MSGVVIYTDLDGTLLDHHTYSAEAASATLSKLRGLGIPVIPCTSKTVAETRPIAAQLGLDGPMIVENGAAVWIPKIGICLAQSPLSVREKCGAMGSVFRGLLSGVSWQYSVSNGVIDTNRYVIYQTSR